MSKYFKYFIYVTIAFLVVFLMRTDSIGKIEIQEWKYIIFSIPFLLFGFIGQAFQWKALLREMIGGNITSKDAIISTGLTIFGKYIPGKVWIVVGRAAYISKKINKPINDVTWTSLVSQVFTLWVGLVLGGAFILLDGSRSDYSLLIIISIVCLSFFIFSERLLLLAQKFVFYIIKKSFRFPHISIQTALKILPYYLFTWLSWSFGFYLLCLSVYNGGISIFALSVFPVAASLGIMAIIVPGGLGVREGVLAGLLVMFGVELSFGLIISIVQRFWFLIGELFIFIVALVLNKWKLGFDDK